MTIFTTDFQNLIRKLQSFRNKNYLSYYNFNIQAFMYKNAINDLSANLTSLYHNMRHYATLLCKKIKKNFLSTLMLERILRNGFIW